MDGWIYLYKSLLDWEWYDDANTFRVFLHLLLLASYENKKWHGKVIQRGQVVTSPQSVAEDLGLTRQKVRTAFDRLKSTNELTIETTNRYSLVTINNYTKFQKITTKLTNNQPTDNQQITTSNKDNKYKGIIDTAKNSLVPCTQEELYAIADKLNIPDSAVKEKHETILGYIETGEIGPKGRYRNKTTYLTLLDWLKKDVAKGYIHHMTAEDLVFREAERTPTPDWILETLKTF